MNKQNNIDNIKTKAEKREKKKKIKMKVSGGGVKKLSRIIKKK